MVPALLLLVCLVGLVLLHMASMVLRSAVDQTPLPPEPSPCLIAPASPAEVLRLGIGVGSAVLDGTVSEYLRVCRSLCMTAKSQFFDPWIFPFNWAGALIGAFVVLLQIIFAPASVFTIGLHRAAVWFTGLMARTCPLAATAAANSTLATTTSPPAHLLLTGAELAVAQGRLLRYSGIFGIALLVSSIALFRATLRNPQFGAGLEDVLLQKGGWIVAQCAVAFLWNSLAAWLPGEAPELLIPALCLLNAVAGVLEIVGLGLWTHVWYWQGSQGHQVPAPAPSPGPRSPSPLVLVQAPGPPAPRPPAPGESQPLDTRKAETEPGLLWRSLRFWCVILLVVAIGQCLFGPLAALIDLHTRSSASASGERVAEYANEIMICLVAAVVCAETRRGMTDYARDDQVPQPRRFAELQLCLVAGWCLSSNLPTVSGWNSTYLGNQAACVVAVSAALRAVQLVLEFVEELQGAHTSIAPLLCHATLSLGAYGLVATYAWLSVAFPTSLARHLVQETSVSSITVFVGAIIAVVVLIRFPSELARAAAIRFFEQNLSRELASAAEIIFVEQLKNDELKLEDAQRLKTREPTHKPTPDQSDKNMRDWWLKQLKLVDVHLDRIKKQQRVCVRLVVFLRDLESPKAPAATAALHAIHLVTREIPSYIVLLANPSLLTSKIEAEVARETSWVYPTGYAMLDEAIHLPFSVPELHRVRQELFRLTPRENAPGSKTPRQGELDPQGTLETDPLLGAPSTRALSCEERDSQGHSLSLRLAQLSEVLMVLWNSLSLCPAQLCDVLKMCPAKLCEVLKILWHSVSPAQAYFAAAYQLDFAAVQPKADADAKVKEVPDDSPEIKVPFLDSLGIR